MWKQKVDGKNERLHVSKDRESSRKEKLRVTNWIAAGDQKSDLSREMCTWKLSLH